MFQDNRGNRKLESGNENAKVMDALGKRQMDSVALCYLYKSACLKFILHGDAEEQLIISSLFMSEHESPSPSFSLCRQAGKRWGQGGSLPLPHSSSLGPIDSCSGRPSRTRTTTASQRTQGRTHACSRPRRGSPWNKKRPSQRSLDVYSVCPVVSIFEGALCVWVGGRRRDTNTPSA